jgi:hypothetical protein
VLFGFWAGTARADGDPASDILLGQDVFLTYSASKGAAASGLERAVAQVYAHGDRLKVAVIANDADLGSVPSLMGDAPKYARFLGTEIESLYVGPLLIVMPSGYGIYDGGRKTTAESKVLAGLEVKGSTPDGLIDSATHAVQSLLAANALRSKDILPPGVYLMLGTPKSNGTVDLSFSILEDSRRVSDTITVLAGLKRIAVIHQRAHTATYPKPETVLWRVPTPRPKGKLQFCVDAVDGSGNKSPSSCAPFGLR